MDRMTPDGKRIYMENGNLKKILISSLRIKTNTQNEHASPSLQSPLKAGRLERAQGQGWDTELGRGNPFHPYLHWNTYFVFCLRQFPCSVICIFFHSVDSDWLWNLYQPDFYPCGNVIKKEGRRHTDLLHAHTALFLLYISQWKLIANYPNISLIIFQALS